MQAWSVLSLSAISHAVAIVVLPDVIIAQGVTLSIDTARAPRAKSDGGPGQVRFALLADGRSVCRARLSGPVTHESGQRAMQLTSICTDHEYQRRGLASALLEAIFAFLREDFHFAQARDVHIVYLTDSVRNGFYERRGFSACSAVDGCLVKTV